MGMGMFFSSQKPVSHKWSKTWPEQYCKRTDRVPFLRENLVQGEKCQNIVKNMVFEFSQLMCIQICSENCSASFSSENSTSWKGLVKELKRPTFYNKVDFRALEPYFAILLKWI